MKLYLSSTREEYSFSPYFYKLIHQRLSTIYFLVLLNGSKFESIRDQRGLRQGDHLSPYIFIIGLEVFSKLLLRAEPKKYSMA